jgi:hypothetical protein
MEASYNEFQKLKPLTEAIEERKKQKSPNAADNTADIEKQIKAVEDGTRTAPGLGRINRDLTRLLDGVEAADQRPTDPQIQAVNQVCDSLVKVMTLWATLNENLRKQNPLNLPITTDLSMANCTQ